MSVLLPLVHLPHEGAIIANLNDFRERKYPGEEIP
jgi:hypothetical protein